MKNLKKIILAVVLFICLDILNGKSVIAAEVAAEKEDVAIQLDAIGDQAVNAGEYLKLKLNAENVGENNYAYFTAEGLPTGINMDCYGMVYGSTYPEQVGSYEVTFTVTNGYTTDSETITLEIKGIELQAIGNQSVNAGDWVELQLNAENVGENNYAYYRAEGLPTGMTLYGDGMLHGSTYPEQVGSYEVTFTVTNGYTTDSETITLEIKGIELQAIGNQSVNAGDWFELQLNAENVGENKYAYYRAEGLPTGMTLYGDGMLHGSTYPEQVGSYEVTFTVTNGYTTDSETITLEIKGIELQAIGNQSVNAGDWFELQLNAENVGENNYAYYRAEGLPTGMTLYGDGMLHGSTCPEQVGSYEVTFTVTNGYTTDSETITLEIKGIELQAIGNQSVNAGDWVELQLNAENVGENNYAYYRAEGLPTGITLYGDGMLHGSTCPEQVGRYEVTFTVTNGYTTDNETITLEIKGIELQAIGNQSVNAGDWFELQLNAENVGENNYAYYRAEGLPTGMTLYGDGMLHGSTCPEQVGRYEVTFTVTNGYTTDSETITLTII